MSQESAIRTLAWADRMSMAAFGCRVEMSDDPRLDSLFIGHGAEWGKKPLPMSEDCLVADGHTLVPYGGYDDSVVDDAIDISPALEAVRPRSLEDHVMGLMAAKTDRIVKQLIGE